MSAVLENYELEYLKNVKTNSSSLVFSENLNSTAMPLKVIFSNDTSVTEIERVITEKQEFENCVKMLLVTFLEIPDSYDFDAKININDLRVECCSTRARFLVETFMEKFKPVVLQKLEFENRTKAKLIAFWEILNDQELVTLMKTIDFLLKSYFENVMFSMQALLKETTPIVAEKKEFEYRNLSILMANSESSAYQVFGARHKTNNFSNEYPGKNTSLLIGT